MRLRIYLALIAAGFLFVAYWFIMHSYVFVKLSAVLGFLLILALCVVIVTLLGKAFGLTWKLKKQALLAQAIREILAQNETLRKTGAEVAAQNKRLIDIISTVIDHPEALAAVRFLAELKEIDPPQLYPDVQRDTGHPR